MMAIAILLWGCAPAPLRLDRVLPESLPSQALIPSVPFFAQEAYQCGPAAMAMLLAWSGLSITPDDLTPIIYTPDRRGSLQTDLIGAARRNGRLPYPVSGLRCLLSEIAAGHPVIILQNLGLQWLPRWHYAVAIGYDQAAGQIVLHSGVTPERRVGLATFQRTWRRAEEWALVVVPPDALPACAQAQPFLEAALALQTSGQAAAAASAFESAAGQWPDNFAVMMALGNQRYRAGDPPGAAEAFQQATRIQPGEGTAFNNLAHVFAELERWDEAESAALRATELGGRHVNLFRQTLQEIRLRRQ